MNNVGIGLIMLLLCGLGFSIIFIIIDELRYLQLPNCFSNHAKQKQAFEPEPSKAEKVYSLCGYADCSVNGSVDCCATCNTPCDDICPEVYNEKTSECAWLCRSFDEYNRSRTRKEDV